MEIFGYNEMIWKQIPSQPTLEASEDGQIRDLNTKVTFITFLAGGHDGKGYRAFYLPGSRVMLFVHRLVCEAFHGPSSLDADHFDENKMNNAESNLQWLTHGANSSKANRLRIRTSREKINRGKAQRGENNPVARLTDADVVDIKRQLLFGITQTEIAKRFKVAKSTIGNIKQGNSWKHL